MTVSIRPTLSGRWASLAQPAQEPPPPEDTLFVFDYPNTVRQATIVTTYGIIMVHAEMIPTTSLPSVDVFTTVATNLAHSAAAQLFTLTGS